MGYSNISAEISAESLAKIEAALATIDKEMPFLINLTVTERRQFFKMGDKSMAFVSNSITAAQQNQAILPSNFDLPELNRDFELAKTLTSVLSSLKTITERVDDTLLAVGSEAMRSSLNIYDYVKASAKYQHGLKSVAEQLGERFKAIGKTQRRNRRTTQTP
ncbi:hypothetical protein C7271_11720 [filamentous cyanobacterium CCP5]|nr:hypothetical protein C7271_11720 [filamentous cyanobacterium CCP5]